MARWRKTYAYAICGGLIATFTVTPALCALLLHDQESEKDTLVVRVLHRVYEPVSTSRSPTKILTLGVLIVLLVGAGFAVRTLGLEFLPKLEEGNMWIRATMPTSISLEEGNAYVNRMRKIMDLPGGRHRRLAARPAGRRHRRDRVLQCRVLRPA